MIAINSNLKIISFLCPKNKLALLACECFESFHLPNLRNKEMDKNFCFSKSYFILIVAKVIFVEKV
jgi:hypothetical protein